ncbi:MAG TPA: DUF2142 domain-containing protein [Verrucomicrobiae bacterium]|nr:DUF2142 domain-containing protein [Verrucomicrobiae bacterium]
MNIDINQSKTGDRKFLLLFCLLAAAHVLVFSAAFPFFSVVDEQAHFDLVTHYAEGRPPRTLSHTSKVALPYIVCFSTPEYLHTAESQPGGVFRPPWKLAPEEIKEWMAPRRQFWQEVAVNHEASQPPLYYILAGGWWRLGETMGLRDSLLLQWLRCLNALIVATVVWLAGVTSIKIFPGNRFIQLAMPALAAFFPQSLFYAINNDVLCPLVFGMAFLLLLKFYETEKPGLGLAAATGLAVAAVFLTKISNLPLLAVAGLFLVLKIADLWRAGGLRPAVPPLAALFICAAVPMAAWMAWCQTNFGDLTGTAQKIKFLNWTNKPPGEWLHHPLFTVHGFWFFLKNTIATFWQGEQLWHFQPLASPAVSFTYVALTLGVLATALAALLRPRSGFTTPQRRALSFGFLCGAAMLAFFALLSVKYDFQDCFYPSREHPFFVSGRLMLGMLIPFLLLFAAGLERLMLNFQMATKFFLLVVLLGFMLVCEITADLPVFASQFNWFHQ